MHKTSQKRQEDAHAKLATRIRNLRDEQSLSQAELAAKAGFARSTLSKIENGQLSPTFEILLKIARGFGVDLPELVRLDAPQLTSRLQVVRGVPEHGFRYENHQMVPLASDLKGRGFQSAIVTFTTSDIKAFGPWNEHETEDMLFVLSGRLAFYSEGYATVTLDPGDSLHFDGTMPHACLSGGLDHCTCLYVWRG